MHLSPKFFLQKRKKSLHILVSISAKKSLLFCVPLKSNGSRPRKKGSGESEVVTSDQERRSSDSQSVFFIFDLLNLRALGVCYFINKFLAVNSPNQLISPYTEMR